MGIKSKIKTDNNFNQKHQSLSWDIVLFNSRQTITSVEEIDELLLEPTDFDSVFERQFENIVKDGNHRSIKEPEYEIEYFIHFENVSNIELSLYGEQGLFEIVLLAKQNDWQIYDSGLDEMIDLENPGDNGYDNFNNYVKQIINRE